MRFTLWHRLLCFLGIRNPFDWAPPGLGPEVPHPYFAEDCMQCCRHCGGGSRHKIHIPPFNPRRQAEIEALELARAKSLPGGVYVGRLAGYEETVKACEATQHRYVEPGH